MDVKVLALVVQDEVPLQLILKEQRLALLFLEKVSFNCISLIDQGIRLVDLICADDLRILTGGVILSYRLV